jgi:osmotically-inducible protein OsmY
MTDEELRRDVAAELSWDPKVPGDAMTVSARNGTVTLHGTVRSLRERREAGQAAARVRGVTAIDNRIEVLVPDGAARDDTELCGDVLNALMLNVLVPMTVTVRARDCLVTLGGTARWQQERDEAELCTSGVPGVAAIINRIRLVPAAPRPDTQGEIMTALRRSALLGDCAISVETTADGTVILAGTVLSWAARTEAVATAWAAPGVADVRDRLAIRPPAGPADRA